MTAVETPPDEARPWLGAETDQLLAAALEEDLGPGDVTTDTLVPAGARARARLITRAPGVLAGVECLVRVFELLHERLADHHSLGIRRHLADGARVEPDVCVLELEGSARALLVGERTALNFVQHLSGVATLTARFVEAVRPVRVLDTRKTLPGLRRLEKYAVLCGGGENHRFGLFDQAMVKNNHLDLTRANLRSQLAQLRRVHGSELRITAEARDEREALDAVAGDADVVLLDNFVPAALRALCPRLREAARARARPLELEASGGITLANAPAHAGTGVERISIGALTHSAPALDLSLRLEPLP